MVSVVLTTENVSFPHELQDDGNTTILSVSLFPASLDLYRIYSVVYFIVSISLFALAIDSIGLTVKFCTMDF